MDVDRRRVLQLIVGATLAPLGVGAPAATAAAAAPSVASFGAASAALTGYRPPSAAISDDAQPGKLTSFPQAVQLKDGEAIALAWVVYRNKEDRDRINKAVMEDPQLKQSMDPSKMPFDGKRMFWGGFETIIGLSAG